MMGNNIEKSYIDDAVDSVLNVEFRRLFSDKYALVGVDFNLEGLKAGQKAIGRPYTSKDVLVDIGSNSGLAIAKAAEEYGLNASVICIEPYDKAVDAYRTSVIPNYGNRLSFIQATGENLPLADNSTIGVSLHNVLFRSKDPIQMLREAQRIVKPGGFIEISTNAEEHAPNRHRFERTLSKLMIKMTGIEVPIPKPPAEGSYFESIPSIINAVGGLDILEELTVKQNTESVIDKDNLDDLLWTLKYSAVISQLPDNYRKDWRLLIDTEIKDYLTKQMEKNKRETGHEEFRDPVHRGMYVIRNNKQPHQHPIINSLSA